MIKNFFGARFFVAAILTLALTFFATNPVAQARADINFKLTGVKNYMGYSDLYGYFINKGDSGGSSF